MDELNELIEEYGDIADTIEEFYDIMDISEEQKEERRKLANELFGVFLFLLSLVEIAKDAEYLDIDFISLQFEMRFAPIVKSYARDDAYINQYIRKVTDDVVGSTLRRIDEPYSLSDERALGIALNESNSVLNYEEMADAIDSGYTMKTWRTMRDNRVRDSHKELEGKTIPIDDYFEVGNSLLLFPRDEDNCTDMSDISNCRCSLKYS